MLIVRQMRGKSADDVEEAFAGFLEAVPDTYSPLLRPALVKQAEVLGVAEADIAYSRQLPARASYAVERMTVRRGEVLVRGLELFVVSCRREPARQRAIPQEGGGRRVETVPPSWFVQVTLIGPSRESSGLEEIQAMASKHLKVELEDVFPRSEHFQELMLEGRDPVAPSGSEDVQAARVISDRAVRTLLTAIKSSSGLLVGDASKQLPEDERGRTEDILKMLADEGLVNTESVVICRRTGTQVARMPNEDLVADLDAKGVRCACGKPLASERLEHAVAITERSADMLDGSKWLTVLLVDELVRLGIPLEDILVEQVAGGDEMDCIANVAGDTVLFELKDKTFSLGNAYSFGAKIGIIRPTVSVIVTTDKVGNDAKEHFDRASSAGRRSRYGPDSDDTSDVPLYIEGIDALRSDLEALVTKLSMDDAVSILGDVLPLASVGPQALLNAWPLLGAPEGRA